MIAAGKQSTIQNQTDTETQDYCYTDNNVRCVSFTKIKETSHDASTRTQIRKTSDENP